jgi:hypothetical protein
MRSSLGYDESKKNFRRENTSNGKLQSVVDLVFGKVGNNSDMKEKKSWKAMVVSYVEVLHYLSLTREYEPGDLIALQKHCTNFSHIFVDECGGMTNITNYMHDLISGHVVELSQEYGNLWRFRNDGVEGFNAIVSRRRNCFSNLGGYKRTRADEIKKKMLPVESLGNWCLRTAAYQTSVAGEEFAAESYLCKSESVQFDDAQAKYIADDLGEEDHEYEQDKEWKPVDDELWSEDSDSDYGYESEDLGDPTNKLPPANDPKNIRTNRRLCFDKAQNDNELLEPCVTSIPCPNSVTFPPNN